MIVRQFDIIIKVVNYCDSDSAIYYCDSSSATYSEVLTGNFGSLKHMETFNFQTSFPDYSIDLLVLKVKHVLTGTDDTKLIYF